MINLHIIEGRIIKPPTKRTIAGSQTTAVTATIAIKRSFKNKNGEYDNDLVHISMLGSKADSFVSMCKQGDLISCVGRVQTDETLKPKGLKTYFTKTVVDRWNILAKSAYNDEKNSDTDEEKHNKELEIDTSHKEADAPPNTDEDYSQAFNNNSFDGFNPNGFYNPHFNN